MAEIYVNIPEDVEKNFRKSARVSGRSSMFSRDQKLSIDPNEPIFAHLTIGPKTSKKGRVSVEHDKYLYSKP